MRVLVFISVLDTTSCMQDSSQPVVVVADHICHSSSSQCCQCDHDSLVLCLCMYQEYKMECFWCNVDYKSITAVHIGI